MREIDRQNREPGARFEHRGLMLRMVWVVMLAGLAGGCRGAKAPPAPVVNTADLIEAGLTAPQTIRELFATCVPPMGWIPRPMELSHRHASQVWISPSGRTAYGIIRFNLPFPVPADWTVDPFLDEMKKNEGSATLVGGVIEDKQMGGVRFMAQSHRYRMRIHIRCWGFRGWAVYAGSLLNEPENPAELRLAELARDRTIVPGLTPAPQHAQVTGPAGE